MQFLSFSGKMDEDVTAFLQSVQRVAFTEGTSRDNEWLTNYVGSCLTGQALTWYALLDDDVQMSWKDLRLRLLLEFAVRDDITLVPDPPAAAPPPSHRTNVPPPPNAEGPSGERMSLSRRQSIILSTPVEAPESNCVDAVQSLLNKFTTEDFEIISEQIVYWANKGEDETDGTTLFCVTQLVYDMATNDAPRSELYAKLCRNIMEQISPNVRDEGSRDPSGRVVAGGTLFRKYLLNRCQGDFEEGCNAKEIAAALAMSRRENDGDEPSAGTGEKEVYYAALKAKRQRLGLIRFIGEIFKLQMLTERLVHECIKKLLVNVEDPEEEDIESLCMLLTTVGKMVDTPKAKYHMDIYFVRMNVLAKNPAVEIRFQRMLLAVIELRICGWNAEQTVVASPTIAAVHEQAAVYGRTAKTRGNAKRGKHIRGDSYGGQPSFDVQWEPGF
ncbi:hypothetical protein FRB95_007968 [Tulasnella sp. JGI-2019a]|nr:hypothetical protein FRB95_007968 [Tulasnella sp. JGI-2019a]